MANFCPQCGAPVQPEFIFCGNCGRRLKTKTKGGKPKPAPKQAPAAAPASKPVPPVSKPAASIPDPAYDYTRAGAEYFNKKDYQRALPLFQKAAEMGRSDAQFNLGMMYLNGLGVTKNYLMAANLFQRAVSNPSNRNEAAMKHLGDMYYNGWGVERNHLQALRWYREAALRGRADAQYMVGYMYFYGEGVAKDYNEALKWLNQAAQKGNEKARALLDRLRTPGSPFYSGLSGM